MKIKSKVIAVGSGKGGVGKTLTTINLALAFARNNLETLILDGDLGLSNVDILAGVKPAKTIDDVVQGEATLNDVISEIYKNIKLISSGSGLFSLANLPRYKRQLIFDQLQSFQPQEDFVIIDTGAGINDNVLHFHQASDVSIIVTTPEPHSLTDAYALIKILSEEIGRKNFYLVINQVRSPREGENVFLKLNEVAEKFLKVNLHYLGSVQHDQMMANLVLRRQVLSEQALHTVAAQGWIAIAHKLADACSRIGDGSNVTDLFNSLMWSKEGGGYESTRQAV